MIITMTFRAFLGKVSSGYIREGHILNLYKGIPIRKYTNPRLWKYNTEMYEN
jgi:hypothetical protein